MATRRNRIAALAGTAAMGLTLLVTAPTTADAATRNVSCSTRGGTLHTSWHYTKPSRSTVRVGVPLNYEITGNGRNHNNVYFALRSNGGNTTVWQWKSYDNILGGVKYYGQVTPAKTVFLSARPYVKVHATFDLKGTDPSCDGYAHIGW